MNDRNEQNHQRLYTEEEVLQLFQRFRTDEQAASQNAREERPLPLLITANLEENTPQKLQDEYKRYKRELSKYTHDEWTTPEEINKFLIPKLKGYNVDTSQIVHAIYKGSDIIRTHGRAATEIYEQLDSIQGGTLPHAEAAKLLEEAIESARRLAVFAWAQARQQDEVKY